jgi:hypothetical protein
MKNFILICFILLSTHIWSSEPARVDINDDNEYGNYYEPDQRQLEYDNQPAQLPNDNFHREDSYDQDYDQDYDQEHDRDNQDY